MNDHFIPYGRQTIDEDDISAVTSVLRSDCLTGGSAVDIFESALAEYVGAKYAVAVSNGTAALHLAYLAAGLGVNKNLVTSPLTFAATANAALYTGATVQFADIYPDTGNICPYSLENAINADTHIIAPVHYAGLPMDLESIQKIAKKYNLIVVEDACHALGAEYKGEKIGSCEYSDMSVFSFHPVKSITTGEGGAITTNNPEFYEKLKLLRSHGIITHAESWRKDMIALGYNCRITDIQCALGFSQLKKLDKFISRRKKIAEKYDELFADEKNLTLPVKNNDSVSAFHLYPVLLSKHIDRAEFIKMAKTKNIGLQVHYGLVFRHPYYISAGYSADTPNAEDFSAKVISLPIFPALTDTEQLYVAEQIKELIKEAGG